MSKNEKTALVPRLRFPEYAVNGAVRFETGDVLFEPISNKNQHSDLPVLAITQEHGAIPRDQIDYNVSVTDKSLESYKVVEIGDFIISLRSFQGGIEYSLYHGICSPAYIILRKRLPIVEQYYKYYFKTDRFIQDLNKDLEGIRDGKMVSYSQFSAIMLPKPDNNEQKKIADCLSSLDGLIDAEDKKLQALKAHKKGLMQKLFPAEGKTVPEWRFPEFRDSSDWDKKKFGELCSFIRGPFGGALKKEIFVKDGYAVYEQSHAIYGDFSSFRYYITKEKYDELKRFAVCADDIIMSCSGTMGKFAIVPMGAKKGVINQALLKLTVKKDVDVRFTKMMLELDLNQEKLLSQSAGGAIKNIVAVSLMKEIPLLIPHIFEQQKIADCLSSIDDLIGEQTKKIGGLKDHKKGLLQGLFPSIEEVSE